MYKEKAIRILDELLNLGDAGLTQEQRYAIAFSINKGLILLPPTTPINTNAILEKS